MQRSGSQKVLLVLSIIKIVFAVISVLFGLFAAIVIGTANPADLSSAASDAGMSTQDLQSIGVGIGIGFIAVSLIDVLLGVLGVRAANDNQKIMPVWWLSLIALIGAAIGIISIFVQGDSGNQIGSYIGSAIGSAIIFWIANNIKRQAGK